MRAYFHRYRLQRQRHRGFGDCRRNTRDVKPIHTLEGFVPVDIAGLRHGDGRPCAVIDHAAGKLVCAAFDIVDAKAAVSGDDAGGVNTEAAQLPNAGIRDIAASSMQAPYPSPRRKRQISSSPLHLLFRPNPLRWASVEFCAARRRNVRFSGA